jgi:hypothetical protein
MQLFDFSNWNWNSYKAAGKHVASYIAGGLSVAVTFHFISPTDASGITDNISTISDGLTKVATGVAGLLAILTPIYTTLKAAHNASAVGQATGLVQASPGTKIVTTPEIAAAVPSNNVVSNTEAKVTSK